MNNKYKIIISNKNIYREVELPIDAATFRVGTTQECEVRLDKDLFFCNLRLDFINNGGSWTLMCSDKIFITAGDTRRLINTALNHGDIFQVKYQDSGNDIFTLEFMVDFESENRRLERCININGANTITIGKAGSNNIVLNSKYVINDSIELIKDNDGYRVNVKNSTYGFYKNGTKITGEEHLKNMDFFSVSDFIFYLKDNHIWTEISDRITVNGLQFSDSGKNNEYPLFTRNTRVKFEIPKEPIGLLVAPEKPKAPEQNLVMTLFPALAMIALTVVVRGFMSNSSNMSFIIFSVCSMAMGVITSSISYFSSKKKYKKDLYTKEIS